ncbi:hypothetical protein B9G69_001485 [Bdellovibrio sp. SKB1291214]|uniref:hypothetical protein n=1 Tax=Bdellovibrio sp. SKB1291214 TaxID=1732569 RepID=UPI000B5192F8|nr:hypothetical protein [Bdellovibrio sp. SKB1291214]UYL09245.1 hypothetical protein B9G69_001485 [Bdellovibrio sp. SKB1291214]
MGKIRSVFVVGIFLFSMASLAEPKQLPVNGRLFIGSTNVSPTELNTSLESQSMKKVDSITQYGVEIVYPAFQYLDVGVRYAKRTLNNDENPANAATDYTAKIDQDTFMFLARVPFYKSDVLRLDAFAGAGGSNTTYTIKSATEDGSLTKKANSGWFATPYAAAGASLAVGYKWIYFIMEGGIESNKPESFDRSGSVSSNINQIDLSGGYLTIGILFTGVPGTIGK